MSETTVRFDREVLAWLRANDLDAVADHIESLYREIDRARDEIVAQRAKTCALAEGFALVREANRIAARNEALEEGARVVEDYFNPETAGECAAAIRALKDQP